MKPLVSLFLVGVRNVYAQYSYQLRDVYDKDNYLDQFTFQNSDDRSMSHGSVLYVDSENLSGNSNI
jgi:hypothetical protein